MASLYPNQPHEPETLMERLARSRDLAGPRAPGDTFGQGGWQHPGLHMEPPAPPSVWLTLLPFGVLLAVAVALTIILIVAGQSA